MVGIDSDNFDGFLKVLLGQEGAQTLRKILKNP